MTESHPIYRAEMLFISVFCSSLSSSCFSWKTFDACTFFLLFHAIISHHSSCCISTTLFFLLLLFLLLPSGSSVRSQPSAPSRSAGLNVAREALLKAQGPISLVQMHGSHQNFMQIAMFYLNNYEVIHRKKPACPSRFCSFPLSKPPKP